MYFRALIGVKLPGDPANSFLLCVLLPCAAKCQWPMASLACFIVLGFKEAHSPWDVYS